MKRIRFRIIILTCGLVVLSNLERLLEPLHYNGLTYMIALVMVLIALIGPRVVRIPLWMILTAPVLLLLIYEAWIGLLGQSISIPFILVEGFSIGLTALLAHWVNLAISEFESSVAHITIGHHSKSPEPDSVGQGLIYREVRRSRNHQRPLTLMTIEVDEKSIKVALDRMVQQAQLAMMKQYTLSNVSKTLCDKLEDSDIIVQRNDHFLIVLPETRPEHIPGVIERLRQQVSDQVGVDLKIGTASLPIDGFTLEGLIDKATAEMQADLEPHRISEIERLAVNQNPS